MYPNGIGSGAKANINIIKKSHFKILTSLSPPAEWDRHFWTILYKRVMLVKESFTHT